MPTLSGSITISDLLDGVTGASVVVSNEAHTFVASADGEITTGELAAFFSDFQVFVGSDSYTWTDNTNSPGSSQFSIRQSDITALPSGHDLAFAIRSSDGRLTVSDAGNVTTGFDDADTAIDSVTITIPVYINIAGTVQTYNRTISLTKAKGGDAKLVRVSANRQTVEYAFGATAPKSTETNLVFTGTFLNFGADDADATWSYSVNGGAFAAIDADSGTISGTNNSTLTVTPTQFDHAIDEGTEATFVTYRCTRDTRFDQTTAVLLRDAEGGYSVIIEVTSGVQVFKNDPDYNASDTNTFCDLQASLFRGGVDISTDSSVSYLWAQDGTDLTANSDLAVTQPSGQDPAYGFNQRKIRVGANDIDDNGSNRFTCKVTF